MEELKNFFREYHCYATVLFLVINVLWFVYMYITGAQDSTEGMLSCGAMTSDALREGEYLRLLTAAFVHFDIRHLCNNMLLLLVVGAMLEQHIGTFSFFIVYIFSGIGGNVISCIWHVSTQNIVVSAGASGAVFGIVGGYLAAIVLNWGHIKDMTVQRLLIFAGLSLYQGFVSQGIDNSAHLGGFLCGFFAAAVCGLIRKKIKNFG